MQITVPSLHVISFSGDECAGYISIDFRWKMTLFLADYKTKKLKRDWHELHKIEINGDMKIIRAFLKDPCDPIMDLKYNTMTMTIETKEVDESEFQVLIR